MFREDLFKPVKKTKPAITAALINFFTSINMKENLMPAIPLSSTDLQSFTLYILVFRLVTSLVGSA